MNLHMRDCLGRGFAEAGSQDTEVVGEEIEERMSLRKIQLV